MLCLSQACLGKSSCVIIATNRKLTPKAVLCIYSTHGTGGSLSADGWQPYARACLLATCAAPQRGGTRGRSRWAICAAVVRFPSVVHSRFITMMQCTYFDRKNRRRLLRPLSLRSIGSRAIGYQSCYSRRQCDYPVLSHHPRVFRIITPMFCIVAGASRYCCLRYSSGLEGTHANDMMMQTNNRIGATAEEWNARRSGYVRLTRQESRHAFLLCVFRVCVHGL